uniref:Transmembrane protein n=1 Tax=Schlesneria paludicola TaxID=360056 RepID=A0A7C2NVK8_9PLAN
MSSEVRKWGVVAAAVVAAAVGLFRWWTYPPAVEFDNLKYIQLLSTALSSRNSEWVDKVALAVTQRHAEGQMSDSELGHFEWLIALARRGEWEQADRVCFRFAEAQLSRRRSRPPTAEAHDHGDHQHHSAEATASTALVRSR